MTNSIFFMKKNLFIYLFIGLFQNLLLWEIVDISGVCRFFFFFFVGGGGGGRGVTIALIDIQT